MSVFDRRRAEALARELDGADAGPASPARALALQLRAASVGLAERSAPRPEFRDALRTRLVAVATVRPVVPEPTRDPARAVRRGAAVAAGALASVVAVSGVAVASSASLPGEPFYEVKRAAEGVQLALAGDAAAEGERHLQFAATRLDEIDGLVRGRGADRGAGDAPDWARVQATLADMDDDTRAGSRLLAEAWESTGDPDLLALLSGFTAEQAAGLQALLPAMGPAAREQAQASLALVDALAGTTRALAEAPGPGGAPSAPATPSLPPSAPAPADPSATPTAPAPTTAPPSDDPAAPADEPPADDEPGTPPSPTSPPPGGVPTPLPTLPAVPVPTGATSSVTPPPSLVPSLDPLLSPAPLPS